MTAEQKLDRTAKVVKSAVYLIGVIVAINGSVSIAIDRKFELKVHEVNSDLYSRVKSLEIYTNAQIERMIIKEYEKLKQGKQGDILKANLEEVLRTYPMIKSPSQRVTIAYEALHDLYKKIY